MQRFYKGPKLKNKGRPCPWFERLSASERPGPFISFQMRQERRLSSPRANTAAEIRNGPDDFTQTDVTSPSQKPLPPQNGPVVPGVSGALTAGR